MMKTKFLLIITSLLWIGSCKTDPEVINEPAPVSTIQVSQESLILAVGGSLQITAAPVPEDADPLELPLVWESANTAVAAVSTSGLVTAMEAGTTEITVHARQHTEVSVTIPITVTATHETITTILVSSKSLTLASGGTLQVAATPIPMNSDPAEQPFVWESANSNIATVNADGLVTAVSTGATEITVRARQHTEVFVTIPVTVSQGVEFFEVAFADPNPLIPGSLYASKQLVVTTSQTTVAFTYTSNNTSVATVNPDGLVTAVAPGNASITVSGALPGAAPVTVTIPVPIASVETSPNRAAWTGRAGSSYGGSQVRDMFDNNFASVWHSQTSGMPQWFEVDMGGYKKIDGLYYFNAREHDKTALAKDITVEVSINGTDWTAVKTYTNLSRQITHISLPFPAPVTARYFRVTVIAVHGGDHVAFAEIHTYNEANPLPPDPPAPDKPCTGIDPATTASEGLRLTADRQNGNARMDYQGDHDAITYPPNGVFTDDPYVFSTPLTQNIHSNTAYIRFEYQSNIAADGCQIFVFPSGEGDFWYTDLRYALTDEWTCMTIPIPANIAQRLGTGNLLRFDLNPGIAQVLRIRNLEIRFDPPASTPPPPAQTITMERAIEWFYDRMNRGANYDMNNRYEIGDYLDLNGDGRVTGDCSSAVMYALRWAGASDWGALNTDSMHAWLVAQGFRVVSEGRGKIFNAQRGDIFIWGQIGHSGGAAGHTGIFVNENDIIHLNYGYDRISVDNYNNILYVNDGDNTYEYLYRYIP